MNKDDQMTSFRTREYLLDIHFYVKQVSVDIGGHQGSLLIKGASREHAFDTFSFISE
jgi:hypothetical protein